MMAMKAPKNAATKKASAKTPATNNKAMVEEREAESYEYVDRVTETVLPHTSLTGGIEGVKDPYPSITYRKFEGNSLIDEQQLTDIKNKKIAISTPVPLTVPTPASLAQATITKQEGAGAAPTDPTADLVGMMAQLLEQQKLSLATSQPVIEEPKSVSIAVAPPVEDFTTVRFEGAFGEVSAPFSRVIDGQLCVAIIQDTTSPFNYNPPVADDVVITMEWKDKGNTRTQGVINAGLGFDLDGTHKVVILLKT